MSNRDALVRIYSLTDPRCNSIRYIGKTIYSLKDRLHVHMASCGYYKRRHVCHWLSQLKNIGLHPRIEILEEVPPGMDWQNRETYWIAHFRTLGCRLTNLTIGGEGHHGLKFSDERRRRNSEVHRGKVISDEQKIKQSLAMAGRKLTEEHKRKVSEAGKGRRHSLVSCLRISVAKRGKLQPKTTGEGNGRAKVTDAQVMEIRASKLSLSRLGIIYGLGKTQIARIKRGEQRKLVVVA